MKIGLYFKELKLGELSFKDNKYVFNSNIKGEEEFKENYLSANFYTLKGSKNATSEELFKDFEIFLDAIDRSDVVELADIKEEDSLFEKLYKLAGLPLVKTDYSIEQIKE